MDKKLTDNDIKSHLEWLQTVVDRTGSLINIKEFISIVIDYINRLEARIGVYETCDARKDEAIKHLEAQCEELQGIIVNYNSNLAKQVAENEKLSALVKIQKSEDVWKNEYVCETVTSYGIVLTKTEKDYEDFIADISTEAYKEVFEKISDKSCVQEIKKGLFCKVVTLHDINTLKKEMVGEQNDR